MTAQDVLILSLSKDEALMVRQAHHEDVSFPPTLTLPRKGGGDFRNSIRRRAGGDSFLSLPLEGGGRGGGDRSAAEGVTP
jgi:hypothetical protein